MLAVRVPAHAVQTLGVAVLRREGAEVLSGLGVSAGSLRYLALKEIDRLVAAYRDEVGAVGRVAASETREEGVPHSVNEVLVMRIGVVEFERRTLVEGDQHVIRGRDETEGAARSEIDTKGMTKGNR